MVPRRDDPLPLEAVRDLLADAIDLAASTAPGTVGHRAAWVKAEDEVDSKYDFNP